MSRPEIQTIQGVVVHENMRSAFLPSVTNSLSEYGKLVKEKPIFHIKFHINFPLKKLFGKGASSSPGAKARFKL